MSDFSEKLKNFVTESGYSVYRLSKLTGIERTGLQRSLAGQRLLAEEDLSRMIGLLHLSISDQEDLFDAYEKARIGIDTYTERKIIQRLIESLTSSCSVVPFYELREKKVALSDQSRQPYAFFQGRNKIIELIRSLLTYEICEHSKPVFYLFLPEDKDFLQKAVPPPRILRPMFLSLFN